MAVMHQMLSSMGGSGYEAEATALFARFTSDPGTTRKNDINTCIASLKTNGIWSKLEALWVFAAHDSQASLLNWVSSSHNMTTAGSPTFTTDAGYTGDNTTNYLITPDNISAYSLFTQNSAHLSIWITGGSAVLATATPRTSNGTGISIYPRFTDGNCYVRINDNPETGSIATVANPNGFTLGNRSSSTGREAYRDGSSLGTYGSSASQAVLTETLRYECNGTQKLAMASVGGSLNSTEQSNFYSAMNTLRTAIGW